MPAAKATICMTDRKHILPLNSKIESELVHGTTSQETIPTGIAENPSEVASHQDVSYNPDFDLRSGEIGRCA
jgi:hypothetical protein